MPETQGFYILMKKIKLTQGKFALVDNDDFDKISLFNWYTSKNNSGIFYAARSVYDIKTKKQKVLWMHREIMGTKSGMDTDHINGDGLNNQRKNLRVCTRAENQRNKSKPKNNKSGYKGVSWSLPRNKWRADIRLNGKTSNLGFFNTKEEAYNAYVKACVEYHREFANYNQQTYHFKNYMIYIL